MSAGRIESVRIRGFRSLADVELSNLQNANVLIGANGSGKSNFIRFFEMLRWMLRSRRLGEFVESHGGADDQLYGGNSVTPRMEGELALRTDKGRNDYRFTRSYAHPDRFIFTQEAYRFSAADYPTDAPWKYVSSGNREAGIVDLAQASPSPGVNPLTARVLVHLLKSCQVSSSTTRRILQILKSVGTRKTTTTFAHTVGILPRFCIGSKRKTSNGSSRSPGTSGECFRSSTVFS